MTDTLFDYDELSGRQPELWEGEAGGLLKQLHIGVDDPRHEVHTGEVWQLSDRHHLVVGDIIAGWPRWVTYLVHGVLFLPHPDPYVTLTDAARAKALVMVQPDPYLAGHLLDVHADAFGEESLRLAVAHVWR